METMTVTTSPDDRLYGRRVRLEELRTELNQVDSAIAHHTEVLGRAVAGGAPESEQKRIRVALTDEKARRDGVVSAIPLVEMEVTALEQDVREEEIRRLRSVADQLRVEYEAEYDRTAQDLNQVAAHWAQRGDALAKLHSRALGAQRAVLRADGAAKEDVLHAAVSRDRPGPSAAGIANDTALWRTIRMLISWSNPR
jgi:hypothetical protein